MSAYWILALTLLHCLSAHPINERSNQLTLSDKLFDEIKIYIDELKKTGCEEKTPTFYSPSGRENCTVKAIDCSIQELATVEEECFQDDTDDIYDLKMSLKMTLERLNMTKLQDNPNNCFCGSEKLEEKPFDQFLDNILILLQKLNSLPA